MSYDFDAKHLSCPSCKRVGGLGWDLQERYSLTLQNGEKAYFTERALCCSRCGTHVGSPVLFPHRSTEAHFIVDVRHPLSDGVPFVVDMRHPLSEGVSEPLPADLFANNPVEPVEHDARAEAERQQRQYTLDAEWIADRWDAMRDDEELLVSMGALRVFLRDRLYDALSEPLVTPSDDSPSDGPSDSEEDE
jgi:hypothetical protein